MAELFFDNGTLKQYLDTKAKLKVFVDGQWVTIADPSDVEDSLNGVGQDNEGNAIIFDYRDIEQIKAGNKQMTLDQLQQQAQPATDPAKKPAPKEEPPAEPEGEEAPPEEPMPEEEPEAPEEEEPPVKGPQKASYDPYMVGRNILRESRNTPKSKEKGSIVQISDRGHDYYGYRATIVESYSDEYDIRILNWKRTDVITVGKNQVKFV